MPKRPDGVTRGLFHADSGNAGWVLPELPDLSRVQDLGFDYETTGLRWWAGDQPCGLAMAWREDKVIQKRYLPIGHAGSNIDRAKLTDWMRQELRGKRLFGSHLKFEGHMTRPLGFTLEDLGCTLGDIGGYAALLDDHRERFGLEDVARDYLNRGKIVPDFDISRIAQYPASRVTEYAETDAELSLLAAEMMLPRLAVQDLDRVRRLEERVLHVIIEMEHNGAPCDMDLLKTYLIGSEREYARCIFRIHELTGVRMDKVNSAAETWKVLDAVGVNIRFFTADSNPGDPTPSFTDEILKIYEDEAEDPRQQEVLSELRQARKLASVRSKNFEKYWITVRRTEGILRYALHPLRAEEGGTITGRFSSSGFKLSTHTEGINVQQVPDEEKQTFGDDYIVRRLYRKKGRYWLSADAMQIEFRMAAHYMKNKNILRAYAKNPRTNFHKLVASWMPPTTPYGTVKNTNFCKIYGGGYKRVAVTAGISEYQAKEFVEIYDARLPGVNELLNEATNVARSRGFVRTLLGRRARFKEVCSCRPCQAYGPRYYKALNGVIQGGAADIMKTKLVELHEAREETGLVLRFTVHDEADGDVPDVAAARKVDEILNRQSFDLRVPILWETKVGPNWADLEALEKAS